MSGSDGDRWQEAANMEGLGGELQGLRVVHISCCAQDKPPRTVDQIKTLEDIRFYHSSGP